MTKKQFEAIAKSLSAQKPYATTVEAKEILWNVTLGMARVCMDSNTHFNREKFLAACGQLEYVK